jgi:uncharacterized membrane protein
MSKIKDTVFRISGIFILLAAATYCFIPTVVPWIMAVGVTAFTVITIITPYPGKSIRGKRLYNFQLLSCILMAVSTYLMFRQRNEWAMVMLVAMVFLLYSALTLPKEFEKEKREEQQK